MQQPTQLCNTLACNRGEVTIIYDHGTIVVVDPGVIGQNRSAYSWISYTLLPHIITTTGKTEIDHFIFLQLNKTVLETLSKLAPEKIAKKIYLPEAQKNKQIEELTTACKQYAIGLVQLENDPLSLSLPTTKLKIIPKNSKKSNTNNYSNILVAIRSQEKKQTILPYAWQKNRINKSHIENIQ